MAVRLFVGNLPYSATEAELREHFSAAGPIAGIWIATDRETGRPRGFAFVEFEDRAVAEDAIRRFNNQPFGGRPLAVNEARPQDRGGGGAPPPRRPGPPSSAPRPGPGGDAGGPPRPRPPFRPQGPPDSGFFSPEESADFGRRTRDAAPRKPKKKERDRGREFDKVREPKRPPIQVASGGRFFSSDDFDEDEGDLEELDEMFEDDEEEEHVDEEPPEGDEAEPKT